MKKIALFLVLVLLTLCLYTPNSVKAEDFSYDKLVESPYNSKDLWINIAFWSCKKGTEIKNLKITNKKVIKFDYNNDSKKHSSVYYTEDGEACYVGLVKKRCGKSYVTGDIYYNGSKVKSFKTKIRLYKYVNPFKKIKINKKNLVKKYKNTKYVSYPVKKGKKYKFSYKIKKGFKLKEVEFYNGKKDIKVKNNKKIKVPKKCDYPYFYIYIRNKKQKTDEVYYLDLYKS